MPTAPTAPTAPAAPAAPAASDPTPPAVQPVGTPPEGGRWTWDAQAAEWLRLPEPDQPTDTPE